MIKVVALSDKNLATKLIKLVGEPVKVRRNIREADVIFSRVRKDCKQEA
jgi:hypothetical protein